MQGRVVLQYQEVCSGNEVIQYIVDPYIWEKETGRNNSALSHCFSCHVAGAGSPGTPSLWSVSVANAYVL